LGRLGLGLGSVSGTQLKSFNPLKANRSRIMGFWHAIDTHVPL